MNITAKNTPALSVSGLSLSIDQKQILDDVSVTIKPGECVGLIGPNGAGKTTLLRALLGLVLPDSGDVIVNGQCLAAMTIKERSRYFGYLAQGALAHWPMTVRSIVELGRMPHRHPWRDLSPQDKTIVDTAMERTGISEFASRLVTSLSGGERARVMLARAISVGAPFLLADEPAASLDPHYQLQMTSLLKQQVSDHCGVVVVMHDLNLAQQFCDRLIVIDAGRIVADGKPDDVLSDGLLQSVFRVGSVRWSEGGTSYVVPTLSNAG
uniref:ABC transporter ATP-binding protein n=1 Tax=Kordiimonas aquimaris TaxID=707591 RepID=UPI0021CF632E|nr:ABC transporter ATP-binding protein [Kordiimonas aquimaris]